MGFMPLHHETVSVYVASLDSAVRRSLDLAATHNVRLKHDTFESAIRKGRLADCLPEGVSEYAPSTHDRLFHHRRAPGPSGGGTNRRVACGSYPGNPGNHGLSISVVDGLADRKIGRYHRLPCSGQMKEAGNAMFIGSGSFLYSQIVGNIRVTF